MRNPSTLAIVGAFLCAGAGVVHADEAKYELKIATLAPDNTGWATVLKEYEKNVEAASNGLINVRVFLGGIMSDDENASVKMLARGEVEGVGATTGAYATIIKPLESIELPFFFKSSQEADYILDKVIKNDAKKLFKKNGLIFGFWSENGFRHFGTQWEVLEPADLKGKKVRSQESPPHIAMWEALGAAAQALPTGEVATALKTKAVKGFDQSLLYAIAGGWHLQIQHLTLSAHIYQPAVIAFNKDWFEKLPEDLQAVLLDEGDKLVRKGRKAVRDANKSLLQIFKDEGVKIHTISDAQREKFVEATAGVRDIIAAKSKGHAALIKKIEKGLKKYRSKKKGK